MESGCFTVKVQDPEGTETKVRMIFGFESTSILLVEGRDLLLSSERRTCNEYRS